MRGNWIAANYVVYMYSLSTTSISIRSSREKYRDRVGGKKKNREKVIERKKKVFVREESLPGDARDLINEQCCRKVKMSMEV